MDPARPIATVRYSGLLAALAFARAAERDTGTYHYVSKWHDGTFEVTARMPLIGEWYDADGIRHG